MVSDRPHKKECESVGGWNSEKVEKGGAHA